MAALEDGDRHSTGPGIDGLDLRREFASAHPDLPVIVMTAHSDLDSAAFIRRNGAV